VIIEKKEDKRSSVLAKKEIEKKLGNPVVKQGWREIVGQVLQFVVVGGDLV
jgi:nickel-dependent lactate racemase